MSTKVRISSLSDTFSRRAFMKRIAGLPLVRSSLALLVLSFLVMSCGSNPGSTPGSASTSEYPQFKAFYYGTYIECSGDSCSPGGLSIYVSSEDQQGNVSIDVYYTYSTAHCSGNVTTDGQLALHCNYISVTGDALTSTFHGSISSGGHITGTDTTDNPPGGTVHSNKWDLS
jgi:hypothetical protein